MNHKPTSPVVVITGASAGVGRATVRRFAKSGAQIGLLARGPEGLEAARWEVEQAGGTTIAIKLAADERSYELLGERQKQNGPVAHEIELATYGYRWFRFCGKQWMQP